MNHVPFFISLNPLPFIEIKFCMFTSISPIFRVWEAIHGTQTCKKQSENGILAIHIKKQSVMLIITRQEGWTTLEGVGAWKWHNK